MGRGQTYKQTRRHINIMTRTGLRAGPSENMYIYNKKNSKWYVTRDIWHCHATRDTWHVTCGRRWTFSQNFGSLAITVLECRCFKDIFGESVTQLLLTSQSVNELDGIGPVDNRPSTDLSVKKIMWHMIYDMWHMTCDMWHVTHDTRKVEGGEPPLKSSAPEMRRFESEGALKILWEMGD